MLFKGRIFCMFKAFTLSIGIHIKIKIVAVYAVESLLTMRASVLGCRAKRQNKKPLGALVLALLCLTKRSCRGSLSRGTWNK